MLTIDHINGHAPILVSLALVAYLAYQFFIYPAFLSPLTAIPNAHWSAPISPLWILRKRYARSENATLAALHKRLGPYVRLAPNEVSVNDVDGVKQIYVGGFDKHAWYAIFDNYGVPCMFSERPSKEHSLRKRMISHVYSKSFLQTSPSAAAQAHAIVHERFLPALEASLPEQGIDVYSLMLAAVMDMISAYIWGLARSTNFVQHKGYREHWLELYKSRNDFSFFPQELPRLTAICKRLGVWLYPRWVDDANRELAAFNSAMCARTMKDLNSNSSAKTTTTGADEPVVMKALLAGLDKEAARGEASPIHRTAILQRDLTVQSEVWDHVLAGQETAGLALTYLTWRMSQHQALQDALRRELGGTAEDDPKALDSLPLLHAIVLETLRLHAPIPGPQPRVVRDPGAQFAAAETGTIKKYDIPGGVRVAGLAQTLHRDERVFPEPERWEPRRWLDEGDEERLRAMHRQWWAFSSGGRMCIGSNFAMQEMKLITAAVYSRYTTHILDGTGIEQGDGYTARPASEQLWLRFEKVS